MSGKLRALTITVAVLALIVLAANGAYWLGEQMNDDPAGAGSCAVLVLGYPTRADGTPDPVQRFRVKAGIEVYKKNRCDAFVVSGGAAHNTYVEAQTMAKLAMDEGLPRGKVVVEPRARSTWQNVGCASPLVANFDRVLIVSESLHAFRAKRYACRQSKSLCGRVRAEGQVGPVSLWWLRVPGAIYELTDYLRDKLVFEGHESKNAPICPSTQ